MANDFETLDGSVAGSVVSLTYDLRHLPFPHSTTINTVQLWRRPAGGTFTLLSTLSTASTGSTTDTPASAGEYEYKLVINIGDSANLNTLQSNVLRASTLASSTLTGSVSGNKVSLAWTEGVGRTAYSEVQRSNDAGVTYVPVARFDDGTLTFSEALSTSGTFLYRVVLSVYAPQNPNENIQNTTVTSNVVSLTVVGSVHQSNEQPNLG
jgi:hypothetical protein